LLSPELTSHFAMPQLHPYSRDKHLTVVKGVVVRRESTSSELAEEIARRLDGKAQDIDDALRVAKLVSQLGLEKTISHLEYRSRRG